MVSDSISSSSRYIPLTWNSSSFYLSTPFSIIRSNTCGDNLGQNQSSNCDTKLIHLILIATAALYGHGRILVFESLKSKYYVEIDIVHQKTQIESRWFAQPGSENVIARTDVQEICWLYKIVGGKWCKTLATLKFIMYFFTNFFINMVNKGKAYST